MPPLPLPRGYQDSRDRHRTTSGVGTLLNIPSHIHSPTSMSSATAHSGTPPTPRPFPGLASLRCPDAQTQRDTHTPSFCFQDNPRSTDYYVRRQANGMLGGGPGVRMLMLPGLVTRRPAFWDHRASSTFSCAPSHRPAHHFAFNGLPCRRTRS